MPDTTEIEKKSLEAHVELCAERYRALEIRIDDVKADIDDVKKTVKETHQTVLTMSDKRNTQLIAWGIGIIGFLMAALGYMITHYALK